MRNDEARLNHMLLTLKERGQRITPQRLAILRVLAPSEGHPSVEEIYNVVVKDFPTTSLATVYKTITLLKELGEVLELVVSHCDPTVNQFDRFRIIRGDEVVDEWTIDLRGKSQ